MIGYSLIPSNEVGDSRRRIHISGKQYESLPVMINLLSTAGACDLRSSLRRRACVLLAPPNWPDSRSGDIKPPGRAVPNAPPPRETCNRGDGAARSHQYYASGAQWSPACNMRRKFSPSATTGAMAQRTRGAQHPPASGDL